ncbi:alpha/beta fold hydrolase [Zavarzinia sp. CC-PAN008]|uniref:alpha/beta fold hydrolase n=1 Tax=Zavarzinia sp. CC-PAN008 TaxID=3243332 RepID=UPI003F743346
MTETPSLASPVVPGVPAVPYPGWFASALAMEPESRRVKVAGTDVHYLLWGDEGLPGLLLVHGNGAHARWWSFIAPLLTTQFRVAAMDLSGMGDSGWRESYRMDTWSDEMMAVCLDAGFPPHPTIVGHSFGGLIGILTGSRYGDALAGIVLVDSPISPPPPDVMEKLDEQSRKPTRVYPTFEEGKERFRLAPPQDCENDFVMDWVARTSLRAVEGGWTWKFDPRMYRPFRIGDMAWHLSNMRCRVAVFRGELSSLLPPETGEYMFHLLGRNAPVIEIPQARHHVMLDQPLAFVAALRALLSDWEFSIPRHHR